MEILSDDAIIVLTGKNLKALAHLMAEEMRATLEKKDDTMMLSPSKIATELGIHASQIRQAIGAGHYGHDLSDSSKPSYRATVSEARAYHFGASNKSAENDTPRKTDYSSQAKNGVPKIVRARAKRLSQSEIFNLMTQVGLCTFIC